MNLNESILTGFSVIILGRYLVNKIVIIRPQISIVCLTKYFPSYTCISSTHYANNELITSKGHFLHFF